MAIRLTCRGVPGKYGQNVDPRLSLTLKVEEKKVTLVFLFVAQEPRYGQFVIFHVLPFDATL